MSIEKIVILFAILNSNYLQTCQYFVQTNFNMLHVYYELSFFFVDFVW